MIRKYKIRCKNCGDILETKIPVKLKITCSCGDIAIYSDYIAFGMITKKKDYNECYESLDKNLSIKEVEDYLKKEENVYWLYSQ